MELTYKYKSLTAIKQAISEGKESCKALVEYHLGKIEENKHLNAFVEVYDQEALQRAEEIDQKIKAGTAGSLAGLIIGIKDNLCYANHKVTASSKILENFESLFDATVVERLLQADVIIIGRLGCDEFAMGSANETSVYGPVKNPHDNTKVPGGSSGGSAAAVAADLCQATLGSDTGGSIRQPASFCGIVGMKPTYGRVSRNGLIAFASSFDQIGPFTRSVEDMQQIMAVISGEDKADTTCVARPPMESSPTLKEGKKKLAYLKEYLFNDAIDPEIKAEVLNRIEKLRADGHQVDEVEFPYLEFLVPTYYVLTTAEASSNLARYDGVHFGYRSPRATDLETTYKYSRTEGFGTEVKRRILLGTFVLSSGYYDAYYTKAQKVRGLISQKTKEIFENYDFLILPTTPKTAFDIGQEYSDPTIMYLEDIYTVQANIAGNPAISLPLGSHSNGLPFGVQLVADNFEDEQLLAFSEYLTTL